MARSYTLDEIELDQIVWDANVVTACADRECQGPEGHSGPHRRFLDGLSKFQTWGYT